MARESTSIKTTVDILADDITPYVTPRIVSSLQALFVGRFEVIEVSIKDLIEHSPLRLTGLIECLVCLSIGKVPWSRTDKQCNDNWLN